ncbi:MAG: helix-turn-helix domain-containing protein [Gemmatimonadaceae bacterium]
MSTEPATIERKRMRPEDRRNAVLDAALRVFADAGFRRASLTEVGVEAGVTKGCVYHYFDSKEELLLALMRERSSSAAKACLAESESSTRDEALAMMVKSLWRKYERDGQLELSTVALTELPHAPAVARVLFDEVATPNRAYLRDVLNRMNTKSRASDLTAAETRATNAENELAAILVPYMVMGAALGYRMYRDIDPVKRSSEEIEAALLRILQRGL